MRDGRGALSAALLLAGCGSQGTGDGGGAGGGAGGGLSPSIDKARGGERIEYATALRCLWLSEHYMKDQDAKVAGAVEAVQTRARYFANQRATEVRKSPAQIEQDLMDMTGAAAVKAPPLPSSCGFMFGGRTAAQDAQCEVDSKAQSDQIAADIASGARADDAKIERNEFINICIPLLSS